MAYSTLKRKTPLRKSGFKPRQSQEREPKAVLPHPKGENATEGAEKPKTAKKRPKTSLETHLDIVFSLYIRLRDAMDGGMTRCISCGKVFPFPQVQCGHFFGRANMSTRWDEQNCNAECVRCNCFDDEHLVGYRLNLVRKIGTEAYDELCERAHRTRKWSGDEIRDMIKYYTAEARRLAKEKGINVKI